MTDIETLLRAIKQFLLTLWRILCQLFHELTGLLFLVLAAVGLLASTREWLVYRAAARPELFRPLVATGFVLMMFWFGVTSLARAKRLSRGSGESSRASAKLDSASK